MRKKKPRDLALAALNQLSLRPDFSQNYLNDLLKDRTDLEARDRAFIMHLVQGVLRWRLKLDWIIARYSDIPMEKIQPVIINILRLALYQILFMDKVPESAAVNEAVQQAKTDKRFRHTAPFINGILRALCRKKGDIPFPDRGNDLNQYLSIRHSFPKWMVTKWIEELGVSSTEDLLTALNRIPGLTIRTNRSRVSRERLLEDLYNDGITGQPTTYSPDGIVLEGLKGRIDELASFNAGMFQVQDQAAQITSHILAPLPGDLVLEIGSGYGGKSTHMSELMKGQGVVIALDKNQRRLINHVYNSHRLGIKNIFPVVADATETLSSLFHCMFDRIMVDAPCSGLGVISRHPDSKWSKDRETVTRLASLQKKMIKEASTVLKSGGKMLYVTCTISREENEAVVYHFLDKNSNFQLENLRDHMPDWGLGLINDQGFFKSLPYLHDMDGFFAALFTRNN